MRKEWITLNGKNPRPQSLCMLVPLFSLPSSFFRPKTVFSGLLSSVFHFQLDFTFSHSSPKSGSTVLSTLRTSHISKNTIQNHHCPLILTSKNLPGAVFMLVFLPLLCKQTSVKLKFNELVQIPHKLVFYF